jgi:hypothetical protein
MARPKLDIDRAAKALVYAELHGDEAAAKEFGITVRTIMSYRKRIRDGNEELAGAFAYRTAQVKEPDDWPARCVVTLGKMLRWFERAAEEAAAGDPDTVAAMSAAYEKITESHLAIRILDEQASAQAGADAHKGRPDDVPDAVISAWGSNGSAPRATA